MTTSNMPNKKETDNIIIHALKCSSKNAISRIIVRHSNISPDTVVTINNSIKKVNTIVDYIHRLSPNRIVPYISCNVTIDRSTKYSNKTRIVLKDHNEMIYSNSELEDFHDYSHIIECMQVFDNNQITFSELNFSAKIWFDLSALSSVIIDILLDIVMAHSYSFFDNLNLDEKRQLSENKTDYFIQHRELSCFYRYDTDDEVKYFSLAFLARQNINDFNLKSYLEYWDDFVNTYYSGFPQSLPTLQEQLKKHKEYGHLPIEKIVSKMDSYPNGVYYLIKIERNNVGHSNVKFLKSEFGITQIRPKYWKVISEKDLGKFKHLINNGALSVFRLVKHTKSK